MDRAVGSTENANRPVARLKRVGLFCLRFALWAPVFLIPWWIIVPKYVWLIGQVSGAILKYIFSIPIEAMEVSVRENSVLNSNVLLTYFAYEGEAPIDIALLVNNVPPFIILVLATGGLTVARRLKVLGVGLSVILASHVAFLVSAFALAKRIEAAPEIPTAFGLLILNLPFILWILLAYWDRIAVPPDARG